MASYGVQPTGFVRKRLPEVLAEIEEAAKVVFGAGVIQTAQSPLGQLNGLMASLIAKEWEIAESVYQSYDPDQAEGGRLDDLGRIRLLDRVVGENDANYRFAITNAGRARIDMADMERAVAAVNGVYYSRVFENKGSSTDAAGVSAHSIAVAVLGGNDAEIAAAIRPFVAPGIDTWGNVTVQVVVDGYCRPMRISRPVVVPLGLHLNVRVAYDRLGCPPPSAAAIALAALAGLTGSERPQNGKDVTLHMVRTAVAATYPNVEVVSASSTLLATGVSAPLPRIIRFTEIADIYPANTTVTIL